MKLISLLSGGIDSPVATKLMMKKAEIVITHFHHKNKSTKKIEDIVKVLKEYQKEVKLYLLPFDHLNKEVIMNVPAQYRMIIYRRGMLKISEKILEKEKANGFVTGDSVGQVASQTLENMNVIYKATKYPIIAPLVGLCKEDIIKLAKKIGTYEISIRPYAECCTYMIAKHPRTKAKIEEVNDFEKEIDWNKIIEETIKDLNLKIF